MPQSKYTGKTESHGKQIKDDEQYEALRREGYSKEKAARIANESTRHKSGKKGGKSEKYEDWSKDELREKAKKVGIEGRSKMDKDELIQELRHH